MTDIKVAGVVRNGPYLAPGRALAHGQAVGYQPFFACRPAGGWRNNLTQSVTLPELPLLLARARLVDSASQRHAENPQSLIEVMFSTLRLPLFHHGMCQGFHKSMKPFDPSAASAPSVNGAPVLTAITVMKDGTAYAMCPFFGKCDGILVVDPVSAKVSFVDNLERTAEAMSANIIRCRAVRLICGFVPKAERMKLRAAGVDVRLGSCACEVDELITEFDDLPEA